MPAPARIIEESVVGPSLGREAIQSGLWSFVLGFCLILIYMIFYYGWIPGLIADAALVCNVFLLVGILASFSAVLTLPGYRRYRADDGYRGGCQRAHLRAYS